jgi:hypothetical protein
VTRHNHDSVYPDTRRASVIPQQMGSWKTPTPGLGSERRRRNVLKEGWIGTRLGQVSWVLRVFRITGL